MRPVPLSECHEGIVRELQGDKALVALAGSSHCKGCVSEHICNPLDGKEVRVLCRNPQNLPVDATVRVAFSAKPQLIASVLLFGLPVVGLALGAVIGCGVTENVGLQALIGFLGALVTFIPGYIIERRVAQKAATWLPTIFLP